MRPWKGIKDYKLLPKPLIKDQSSFNSITRCISPRACERTQNEARQGATGTQSSPLAGLGRLCPSQQGGHSSSHMAAQLSSLAWLQLQAQLPPSLRKKKEIAGSMKSSRRSSSYKGCSCYQRVRDSW